MAMRVQQEGAPAVQRWLQVLKAGGMYLHENHFLNVYARVMH